MRQKLRVVYHEPLNAVSSRDVYVVQAEGAGRRLMLDTTCPRQACCRTPGPVPFFDRSDRYAPGCMIQGGSYEQSMQSSNGLEAAWLG